MARRKLQMHPTVRRIVPGTLGYWVETYFEGYEDQQPISKVFFFTRRGALKHIVKPD